MINKEKIKEYQRNYINKHSKIIHCDICGKSFKEYRLKYHPNTKHHQKSIMTKKLIDESNKNLNNKFIVKFD